MSELNLDSLAVGLSDAEKDDLDSMIGEYRRQRRGEPHADADVSLQTRLDSITQSVADLTEMVLTLDRQMAPLVEIIRLSHQKSELLSQRLDAVIAALKKGRKL